MPKLCSPALQPAGFRRRGSHREFSRWRLSWSTHDKELVDGLGGPVVNGNKRATAWKVNARPQPNRANFTKCFSPSCNISLPEFMDFKTCQDHFSGIVSISLSDHSHTSETKRIQGRATRLLAEARGVLVHFNRPVLGYQVPQQLVPFLPFLFGGGFPYQNRLQQKLVPTYSILSTGGPRRNPGFGLRGNDVPCDKSNWCMEFNNFCLWEMLNQC